MNNILILVGSNSRNSINRNIAKLIKEKLGADLIEMAEYNLAMFSEEEASHGFPAKATEFQSKVDKYAKIVLVTPEHNGYLPSFTKNIFDWLSTNKTHHEGKYFNEKTLYIVSASPGATGGETVRDLCSKLLTYSGAKIGGTYGFKNYSIDKNVDADIVAVCNLILK